MAKKVTFSREKSGGGQGGCLVGPVRDSTRQLRASFCVFRGVRDVSVRRGLQLAASPAGRLGGFFGGLAGGG